MSRIRARKIQLEPRPGFAARMGARLREWWASRFGQFFAGLKARIAKARKAKTKAPSAQPAQPAEAMYSAEPRLSEGGFHGAEGTLGAQIRDSANAIVRRQSDLAFEGRNLARKIQSRSDGAVTMTAWAIRFIIAILWGAIAAQLVWAALFENAGAFIYGIGFVERDLFRPLIYIFGAAGFAGTLAVVFGAGVVTVMGNGDNTKVRRIASGFGDKAADLALQFDEHLDHLRKAMNERSRPVEAVSDLSRAHLTALEAAVFFRDVQFLTSDSDAPPLFRGYLFRSGGIGRAGADGLVFMSGILVGAFGMLMMLGMPEITIDLPDLTQYGFPGAVEYWILLGGLVYAMAGLFAELASGVVAASIADGAREQALEAARSGFVARQAPRVEDVIRRIEDAMDVYRARVDSDRGAGSARNEATSSDVGDTPSWRRPPEGPRFVDTGFQAAPKTFRTDAFARAFYKNSNRSTNRGSTSKRGFLGLKKPPSQ